MKKINKIIYVVISVIAYALSSCSDMEIPDHVLDIEYRYELTCSDDIIKYVTPEVTLSDGNGNKQTILIEDNMWQGDEHKSWTYSVHYDSLNVQNTMTVKYISKTGVSFQDDPEFDNTHNINCLILIQEDGNGRRNNYTIIPDFTPKSSVSAETLKKYVDKLVTSEITRGGSVGKNGEIVKIENEK